MRALPAGVRAYKTDPSEDRAKEYLLWHRTLDPRLLMVDVDAIEYRADSQGRLWPVGLIEITKTLPDRRIDRAYLAGVLRNYRARPIQSRVALGVARCLRTDPYLCLYVQGCTDFYVYPLADSFGEWQHFTARQYEQFLLSLRPRACREPARVLDV